MKTFKLLSVVLLFVMNSNCESQTSRIEIIEPNTEYEATSIWRTINDIEFLKSQGYSIHLPKEPLIDSLIVKSKNGLFGNEDYPLIYDLLETKVFNIKDYEDALLKVNQQQQNINDLITKIDEKKNDWDWNFNLFDKYEVVLTLYGTGGSYDPELGTVTLFTDKDGGFKNYKNPTNTIIHEIVHIGMESSIVNKFNLSHPLKERLVDTFIYLMFEDDLPEYRIQNMGDDSIDSFLKTKEDLALLKTILLEFTRN